MHRQDLGAIALQASDYAKQSIKESSSQLIANALSTRELKQLNDDIHLSRMKVNEDLKNAGIAAYNEFYYLCYYQKTIELAKKNRKGNCHELAFLALQYVVNLSPEVKAEVFTIKVDVGGHCFLVMGRQTNSNPNDPATWGEDAYICDPWVENGNNVYKASQYKENLKNHYCTYDHVTHRWVNHIEDFDDNKHRIMPNRTLSTTSIDSYNKQSALFVLAAILKYRVEIFKIAKKLIGRYGKNDNKVEIILRKIKEVSGCIDEIKNMVEDKNIGNDFQLKLQKIFYSTAFTQDEFDKLFVYRKFEWIMRLFCFKPETINNVNTATYHLENNLGDARPLLKFDFSGG